MIVVPATVPVVRVLARMASAMKVPVVTDAVRAATGTAVVVVAVVAVANAKVRAKVLKVKAPTQASVSVSTRKVAPWHPRLLWVRIRLASQGRIVAHAMHRRVSAPSARNAQIARSAVDVAVVALTVQT